MRLFVALWPPPEVVTSLRELPRPSRPGVRWTTEDEWHVTLRFLGEADEGLAAAALDGLAYDERPVAVLGPVVQRLGDAVLHVPVAGVDGLAAAVVRATASVGEPPAARPFRGHLTVARAKRGPGRRVLRRLAGAPVDGPWEVDEVTLVASRLDPEGARYSVVARRPLPAP